MGRHVAIRNRPDRPLAGSASRLDGTFAQSVCGVFIKDLRSISVQAMFRAMQAPWRHRGWRAREA
jgi:hypothetical protein